MLLRVTRMLHILLLIVWCASAWLTCKGRGAGSYELSSAVIVWCDDGGNALIQQSLIPAACPAYGVVPTVTTAVCGYLSEPTVRALALLSDAVILKDNGETVTNRDGCAILPLRTSTNWQYAGCGWSGGSWDFTYNTGHPGCQGVILNGAAWPSMYHSCGWSGVHWLASDHHKKDFYSPPEPATSSSTRLAMGAPCSAGAVGYPPSCRWCSIPVDCNSHASTVSDDGFRDSCVCTCTEGWGGSSCASRTVCTIPLDCDPAHTATIAGLFPACQCGACRGTAVRLAQCLTPARLARTAAATRRLSVGPTPPAPARACRTLSAQLARRASATRALTVRRAALDLCLGSSRTVHVTASSASAVHSARGR